MFDLMATQAAFPRTDDSFRRFASNNSDIAHCIAVTAIVSAAQAPNIYGCGHSAFWRVRPSPGAKARLNCGKCGVIAVLALAPMRTNAGVRQKNGLLIRPSATQGIPAPPTSRRGWRNQEVHARAARGEKRLGSIRRAAIRKHSAPTKVPALASRASSVTPVFVMKAPTAEAPKAIEPIMLIHAASHSRDFS